MIQYSLEVALCWAIMYLIYITLMRRETFFSVNRGYILGSLVLGLLIPLLRQLPAMFAPSTIAIIEPLDFIAAAPSAVAMHISADTSHTFHWYYVLAVAYFIGVAFMTLRLGNGLCKIWSLYKHGTKKKTNNFTIIETNGAHLPFSFLRTIYISKEIELTEEMNCIMKHELTHIEDLHTYDVLFLEILNILFWWNPLVYLFKKELRQIHEYLADAMVLRDTNQKMYGHILLRRSQSGLEIALAHSFFHSHIKQRFKMMNQKQSSRPALVKYLTVIPVLLLMVLLFSNATISHNEPPPFKDRMLEMLDQNYSFEYIGTEVKTEVLKYIEEYDYPLEVVQTDLKAIGEETGIEMVIEYADGKLEKFCSFKDFSKTSQHPDDETPPPPPSPPSPPDVSKYLGVPVTDKTPLFIIDGSEVNPQTLRKLGKNEVFATQSLKTMPAAAATIKYGVKGKNGALIIEGYSYRKVEKQKQFQVSPINTDPKIFKVVDEMPRFPGCEEMEGNIDEKEECAKKKMLQYIYKNLKYPKVAKDNGVEGLNVIQFVINEDGMVSDVNLVRDIGAGCGEATATIVKSMNDLPEKWIPGKHNGKDVKVLYTLPVKFKLADEKVESEKNIISESKGKKSDSEMKVYCLSDEGDVIYKVVEQMPRFPGCEELESENEKSECAKKKMLTYIYTNLKYPAEAREAGIEGMNVIQFEVGPDGSIENSKVVRDIGGGTGEASLRVIEDMEAKVGKWTPGYQRGKAVRVLYTLPVKFKLEGKDNNSVLLVVNGEKIGMIDDSNIESIPGLEQDNIKTINVLKGSDEKEKYNTECETVLEIQTKEDLGSFISPSAKSKLELSEFSMYPNPSRGELNLRFTSQISAPIHVTISDMNGNLVYKQSDQTFAGSYKEQIDISKAPAGILMLTIEQDGKAHSKLVVKE